MREMLLSDRTGTIVVDPEGGEFDISMKRVAEMGSSEALTPAIAKFLIRENISPPETFGIIRNELRISDSYIPVGQSILVVGEADPLPIPHYIDRRYEVSPLSIWKKGPSPLYITDKKERDTLKDLNRSYIKFYIMAAGSIFLGLMILGAGMVMMPMFLIIN
jgi:hypothetical protein